MSELKRLEIAKLRKRVATLEAECEQLCAELEGIKGQRNKTSIAS